MPTNVPAPLALRRRGPLMPCIDQYKPLIRNLFGCSWRLLLLSTMLGLTGCRTVSFYQQAITGHATIVFKKRPLERVVDDPATPDNVRDKLNLILNLKAFAQSELFLPAKGQFRHYADIDRPFVVWDIYAAREFSLDAKHWWYPFVGSLSYRGYFTEQQARKDALLLQQEGYDVFVGGIDAYSTLGWFQDPVLSTFIDREDTDLADLIFHELAHQKVFLDGDTDFNEAFATALAREGVRRWLQAKEDPETRTGWEQRTRREDQFVALILGARRQLEALYAQAERSGTMDADQAQHLRLAKAGVFHQLRADYQSLKQDWGGVDEYDIWFDYPLNNARLNAEATYYEWIPAFEQLLRESGRDLQAFYEAVERLGREDATERKLLLEALHMRSEWLKADSRSLTGRSGHLPSP